MDNNLNDVEIFWAYILSEEPEKISRAYLALTEQDERDSVYLHLTRMATEPGWAEPQRQAATAALRVIDPLRG